MYDRIRRLEPEDAKAFFELRSESVRDTPSAYSMDDEIWDAAPIEQVERMLARPDETNGFYLGAWSGDELVGSLGLVVSRRWKAAHMGTMAAFYVRPAFRRAGVGGALLDALVARARVTGELEQVRGMVPTDLVGARRLLEGRGFVSYGVEPRGRRTDAGYHDMEYVVLRWGEEVSRG